MLGGGVFVTQNKVLPGSYINFVNTKSSVAELGQRGVVAIACGHADFTENDGPIFSEGLNVITKEEFSAMTTLSAYSCAWMLREVFRHAEKVYLYIMGPDDTIETFFAALEPYDINTICIYENGASAVAQPYALLVEGAITKIEYWRDTLGKKAQLVVADQTSKIDYEGVINVIAPTSGGKSLAPWVAGAVAGCKINESCTNMLYDGELTVTTNKTQAQLEQCIKDGQFTFHNVYGEVRVLEDINSLVTTTPEKGEDFKSNQTIRVLDQIANDVSKIFNTKYIGKIPNTESGRVSLWSDIVKHHKALEEIGAIENFDATQLTVVQGDSKKSVVVNDVITVVNAMAQLYMTIVVQ